MTAKVLKFKPFEIEICGIKRKVIACTATTYELLDLIKIRLDYKDTEVLEYGHSYTGEFYLSNPKMKTIELVVPRKKGIEFIEKYIIKEVKK